jgi:uncharacterized protein YbjT (DUF2867 family)
MYLVTGASGNVGGEVIRALLDAGEEVRALTHTDSAPAFAPGAEAIDGDLDQPETLSGALTGVRGVFLLPGYRDMPGVLAEIKRTGVQRVVLLSGSSAASGDTSNAVTAYMIRSEAAVKESGVPWTILRSYGLMSNALRWRGQLRSGDVVSEPFTDVRVAMIDPYDIAAVATSALRSNEHDGQTYVLSGAESLVPTDRVRILGEVLGRELHLDAQSNDDARALMSAQMPGEYVDAFFDFYVDQTLDESEVLTTVAEILGRQPRTFEQWAIAHADAFR